MKIAIIGAGWYGCHVARSLKAVKTSECEVTIFESHQRIFSGISGSFGIRTHKDGLHYPRSAETRKACKHGYGKFVKHYYDFLVRHSYAIYSLGIIDAEGKASKVSLEEFARVCQEDKDSYILKPGDKDWHYQNLLMAVNTKEPSILLGERLRKSFETLLEEEGINVRCNFQVIQLIKSEHGVILSNGEINEEFDYVINATSYHNFQPSNPRLPFGMTVFYQPCLALAYEDMQSTLLPFSLITLDGAFPCIMPVVKDDPIKEKEKNREYIVTHGKYTILGACNSHDEAQKLLNGIDEHFVKEKIKPRCESALESIWPEFTVQKERSETESEKQDEPKNSLNEGGRFKYLGWKSAVLAKIATEKEFRSAVVFQEEGNPIVHIIPGKVTNIFEVAKNVKALLGLKEAVILTEDGYRYVQNSALDAGRIEITEPITSLDRNTCHIQTYSELQKEYAQNDGMEDKELAKSKSGEKFHEKEKDRNSTRLSENEKSISFNGLQQEYVLDDEVGDKEPSTETAREKYPDHEKEKKLICSSKNEKSNSLIATTQSFAIWSKVKIKDNDENEKQMAVNLRQDDAVQQSKGYFL
jgi:hypothetical protein